MFGGGDGGQRERRRNFHRSRHAWSVPRLVLPPGSEKNTVRHSASRSGSLAGLCGASITNDYKDAFSSPVDSSIKIGPQMGLQRVRRSRRTYADAALATRDWEAFRRLRFVSELVSQLTSIGVIGVRG